jgi:hypothetical protein
LGKGGSQRIGLNVEVTEYFVGAPTAKETNLIGVNFSAKEGHGTTGSERSGGDVFGAEAEGRSNGGDGNAEGSCDEGRCNVEPSRTIVEGIDGCYTGGSQPAEVSDAKDKSVDGADDGAARAAEAHKFAERPILLSGELQGNEGGGV